MSFTTLVRKSPVRAATTLWGVRLWGRPWNPEWDPAVAVEEVRRQIEALRDPGDPSVRLSADPTLQYVQPKQP